MTQLESDLDLFAEDLYAELLPEMTVQGTSTVSTGGSVSTFACAPSLSTGSSLSSASTYWP
jgi:hypothetical protein